MKASRIGILLVFVVMPLMRKRGHYGHALTDAQIASITEEGTKASRAKITNCPYGASEFDKSNVWYDAWQKEFERRWMEEFGEPYGTLTPPRK